ncbi:MAG: baseplate J/gp47 family protein [Pseudomonadota bacterium]
MPLSYPTYENLIELGRASIRRVLQALDPTVFASFVRAFIDGAASLAYSVTLLVRDLERQLFPQTATGEFLERWAGYEGLERLAASSAFGAATHVGTPGTVIPIGTRYRAGNGLFYASSAVASIAPNSQAVAALTRSGSVATVTTAAAHSLASGQVVTIAGAAEPEYNGNFSITVTGRDQFTYEVLGGPTTPATGAISVSADFASVPVECEATGQETNAPSAGVLTLIEPVSGAAETATVQFDGLAGGAEVEGDEALRARTFLSRQSLEGVFSDDQIRLAALSINGNTRAFVEGPTDSVCDANAGLAGMLPSPGQVAIYILRDNDTNIIPNATILAATKEAIILNGRLPAHSAEQDVFVLAPTTIQVDIDFATLSPNTITMRNAVRNALVAFFEDTIDFEENVLLAALQGAIQNTQDLQTGAFLQSFSLTSPTADVAISRGGIAVLGTVSFPA